MHRPNQSQQSKGEYFSKKVSNTNVTKVPAQSQLQMGMVKSVLSNSSSPFQDPQVLSTKQMIDDDLNELQSIMQRHHRKKSKIS